jgi:alpha-1,2-mannosyltransferase
MRHLTADPSPQTLATGPRPAGSRLARSGWGIPVLVAVVAFAVRLTTVLHGGGLYAYMGYDDGVYYTAAAKLVFGELPYRDFVLLHPPGIALVLAPFAELGRLTSDREGMAVARVAFMLLGALNAALTARVASVLGRGAALVAGGFTAVWVHAAYVDRTTLLEPLGSLALLVGLLLLGPVLRQQGARAGRAELLGGAALGLGVCVKAWGVVPLAVVGVFVLADRGWRAAVRLVVGAAAAGLVVVGPFLVAAPAATVRMILLDQVGRPESRTPRVERFTGLLGVVQYVGRERRTAVVVLTLVTGLVVIALTLLALRAPAARLWAALLVAHGLLLLAAPIYFPHYSAFLAVPLSLVLGAGASVVSRELRGRVPRRAHLAAAVAAMAALGALGVGTTMGSFGVRYPGERLATFLPAQGCVRADDPGALIQLNVLSRDLRRGCVVHADFTGITYDRLAHRNAAGHPVTRRRNAAWQRYARDYLTSGSATVLVRGRANGFNRATTARLNSLPVLGEVGPWRVLGPARAAAPTADTTAAP